jgi:uncharacterized protein (TIGR03435 family)
MDGHVVSKAAHFGFLVSRRAGLFGKKRGLSSSGMRIMFIFLAMTAASAQTGTPLRFDAASVKPNTLDDHIVRIERGPGGHFSAHGYTLKLLIQEAYEVKGFQIPGGPAWLDVDRYDIAARGRADATRAQLTLMLQSLLTERFVLRIHKVEKEMPGFELSVASGGPKLRTSSATEENAVMTRDWDALVANGITMASFAKVVGAYVSKPVADRTGLTGLYDFRISWTERADQVPDQTSAEQPGVSLISALKDQLGLKVTAKRVSAEIIVIDSVEKASPN